MAPLYSSKHGSKKKFFSRDRPRGPRTSAPPDLSTVVEDSKENQQSSIQGGDTRDVLVRGSRVGSGIRPTDISFRHLLFFADGLDIFLMVVGSLNGFFHGLIITCSLLGMGSAFVAFEEANDNLKVMADNISGVAKIFLFISIALFVTVFFEQSCWLYTGERQATCLRGKALKAILNQEIGFFETEDNTENLVSIVTEDIRFIQEAIEKVGHCVCFMTSFAGSLMAAMYYCWQLGLIALVTLPLIAVVGGLYNSSLIDFRQPSRKAWVEASAIAEETISQVRTVYSSGAEGEMIHAFSSALNPTLQTGSKQGLVKGFGLGALKCVMYLSWACLFWLGGVLVVSNKSEATWVIIALFCIIYGGLTLWTATPDFQTFTRGKIACENVWEVVDRVPKVIDREDAMVLKSIRGRIQLRNVHFAYPGPSTHIPILSGLNLDIPQGTSMALIGSCGSGRSAVLSLIQRFYDPALGEILLDGYDIRGLKLRWLRSQIGMVNQEPAIFSTSIKENILYGRSDATDAEVVAAAMAAHAHSFISLMPSKYDTRVGEGGAKLSEGQRQRIAIARAVLRNPAIFLLDEATSALDEETEETVMDSLSSFMTGRTTVVVAHRMSTARDMDCIAVLNNGRVVELGNHEELLSLDHDSTFFSVVAKEQQGKCQKKDFFPAKQGIVKAISAKSSARSKMSASSTPPWCDSLSMHYYISVNSPIAVSLGSSAFLRNSSANSHGDPYGKAKNTKAWASLKKLAKLSLYHSCSIIFGAFGAIAAGCLTPLSAYALISAAVDLFSETNKIQGKINEWALILAVLGCSSVVICTVKDSCFFGSGEFMTMVVRQELFSAILRKEIGWFDREENSAVKIAVRLTEDSANVKLLCSEYGTTVVRTSSAVVLAVCLAASSSWQMTLVAILLTPFFVMSGVMLITSVTGFSKELRQSHKLSDKLAREAVVNINAVASCTAEERTMMRYSCLLEIPQKKGLIQGMKLGILYGASQSFAQVAIIVALLFCTFLLRKGGQVTFKEIFTAFFVVASTSSELSQLLAVAPDMSRALRAVSFLFQIIDCPTEIDPNSNISKRLPNLKGYIEMRGVKFSYPLQPQVSILNNFNLRLAPGKPVVLVGASGSGKSCVVALLQRFYDPQAGQILIDGNDMRHLNLKWVRDNMALIPQTPAIFNMPIRDNILFGKENTTEQEMIQAAKTANAHSFISALPEGYNTLVGDGGAQLSPGQKLRIALARAILRNSSILLVDEPTSSVDPDSARIVLDVLDRLLTTYSTKTVLIVAHRMTRTIQETCEIAVLYNGCIHERGDHATLLEQRDQYFLLTSTLTLEVQRN